VVTFNNIPAGGTLRTPLFFLEVDPTAAASPSSEVGPALLIGNKLSGGSAASDTLIRVDSAGQARNLFGEGSVLFDMVEAFRNNDAFSELWCLPLDDAGAGTAAVWTLTIAPGTTTATADGAVYLYINGRRVVAEVTSGDSETVIAAAVAAAVTAADDMPVTATSALGVITLTAKHAGAFPNYNDVRFNYADGEAFPAGVTDITIALANGSNNPALSGVGAILGDELFDKIGIPYRDAVSLGDIGDLLNATTGRWAWNRRIYGHAYTAAADSVATLGGIATINDEHVTVIGLDPVAAAPWQVTGAVIGRAGQSLDNDPARPLQTLDLVGILPPLRSAKFTQGQRNTLLFDGVATTYSGADGTVRIERLISTYQEDAFGAASDAFLDVNTLYTLMRFNRRLESMIVSSYPRYKLADNDTPISEGQRIVTPNLLKGALIAEYSAMVGLGWVENEAAFAGSLIVQRSATDPNRVDCLVEPDFINQLRVFAVQNRFRLQYPATAV
jgi:phage tail sheath gpL-like